MDREPDIFDEVDNEAEDAADEQAERAIDEGRWVSHEAMTTWLRSWGTEHELPPPECGA